MPTSLLQKGGGMVPFRQREGEVKLSPRLPWLGGQEIMPENYSVTSRYQVNCRISLKGGEAGGQSIENVTIPNNP